MINYLAIVTYNTSVNSKSLRAYTVMLSETDMPVTHRLTGNNIIDNNRDTSEGVFSSLREAIEAIARTVTAPFAVMLGTEGFYVTSVDSRSSMYAERVATARKRTVVMCGRFRS